MLKKSIDNIVYDRLGINYSAYNVTLEMMVLDKYVPGEYRGRKVIDLGCGDGKVSGLLKGILQPRSFIGIDRGRALIDKARKKMNGQFMVGDVEKDEICGDLGIMWGVLHHLDDPVAVLQKLKANFNSLIIRESVDKKRFFELGHRYNRGDFDNILKQAGVDNTVDKLVEIRNNKSVIAFLDFKGQKKR
ncbi:MAG: class I SAM-dependent methyltransferase [Patescibacteria group bacterium]